MILNKAKQSVFVLIIAAVTTLFMVSCSRQNSQGGQKVSAEAAAAKTKADNLFGTLDKSWSALMASDDKRLWANARIVTEITSLDSYDSVACKKVLAQVEEVKKIRYTQANLGDDNNIDKYDIATDTLWAATKALIGQHPKINKYILVEQLRGEIATALDSQIVYRINYDRNVDSLRDYYSHNTKTLNELGGRYATINKLPLFRLPE